MQSFEVKPDKLPNPDTNFTAYLNALFSAETKAFGQLTYELQREFRSGGSPDIRQLHIDRVSYDADNSAGNFRVVLDIDFAFGCEDIRTQKKDQTSEWSFKVDWSNSLLIFNGSAFAEERSTADEF